MKTLVIGAVVALIGLLALAPVSASAVDVINRGGVCNSGGAANSAACRGNSANPPGSGNPAVELIGKVTKIVAIVAGVVAVVMVLISGIRFATSGGSSEQVKGARSNLTNAIIGLLIIAVASTIISFVMSKL